MTGDYSLKMGANSEQLIVGLEVESITYYSHVTKNCINQRGRGKNIENEKKLKSGEVIPEGPPLNLTLIAFQLTSCTSPVSSYNAQV